MSRGKPSKGPRHVVTLRVEEALWAEVLMLRPQLQDSHGSTRYGAINSYITALIRQDINELKRRIRASLEEKSNGPQEAT